MELIFRAIFIIFSLIVRQRNRKSSKSQSNKINIYIGSPTLLLRSAQASTYVLASRVVSQLERDIKLGGCNVKRRVGSTYVRIQKIAG